MVPLDKLAHCFCFVFIGCVAALLAREMMVLLPICSLLMLLLGALSTVNPVIFAQVQHFTVGGILLFALATSMMRHRASLFSVLPIAMWAYFTGNGYMLQQPANLHALFYVLGIIECSAMLMAIGVALCYSMTGLLFHSTRRLKNVTALLSLFFIF
jgi:hydrogenase/urease accessory protein HupE